MELIIAEKPSVGRTIAAVLGVTETKDGYMQGKGMIVTWCIGHLVELAMPEEYNKDYAHWRQKDLPIIPDQWKYSVSKDSAKQYHIVTALMNDDQVHGIICATDAGREGELIFRLVYQMAGCRKPVRRLWISSLEEEAIRDGFRSMKPMAAYDNLYAAALCREDPDGAGHVQVRGGRCDPPGLFRGRYQGADAPAAEGASRSGKDREVRP